MRQKAEANPKHFYPDYGNGTHLVPGLESLQKSLKKQIKRKAKKAIGYTLLAEVLSASLQQQIVIGKVY